MKKRFAKLSETEQAELEAWYHNMDPQDVVDILSRSSKHHPGMKSRPKLSKNGRRKPESAPKQHASK
jgi:(2Fe-2S) ferredoxin